MSTKIKSEPSEAPTAPFRPSLSNAQSVGATFAKKEEKKRVDVRKLKAEKPIEVIVIEDVDIWRNLELPQRLKIFNVPKSKPISSAPVRVSCGGLGSGPGSKDDWVDPSKYFDINQSSATQSTAQVEEEEEEWGTVKRDGPIHYDPKNESSFLPNPLYKASTNNMAEKEGPVVTRLQPNEPSAALKRRTPGPDELKDFYPVGIEEVVDDVVPGVASGYRKR